MVIPRKEIKRHDIVVFKFPDDLKKDLESGNDFALNVLRDLLPSLDDDHHDACVEDHDDDLMEKYLRKAGAAGAMGIADKYSCRVLAGKIHDVI